METEKKWCFFHSMYFSYYFCVIFLIFFILFLERKEMGKFFTWSDKEPKYLYQCMNFILHGYSNNIWHCKIWSEAGVEIY